jgi:uncharacterized YigZ family protein
MSEVQCTYRTIRELSTGIFKEKGSKFIALAAPCYSEEEAKQLLDQWRKEHHQSRHLCYAYRLGLDKKIFRANDDGEPNNSAGIPILGQIQSFDLTNILVGVIRYFGGTKLGVGGLVQAYKTAAKESLEVADIIEVEVFSHFEIEFNYDEMPGIMNLLKQRKITISTQRFNEDCYLEINVELNKTHEFEMALKDFKSVFCVNKGMY